MPKSRIIALIYVIIAMTTTILARDYEPSDIVNPNIANRFDYVADPEHRLSDATHNAINRRLQSLRDSTSAEVAVAVVPSIGDYTIEDFSEKVFTKWGLGKKDKDNGVLLLISPDSREVRIQTGYGAEGVLPDITCGYIIRNAVIPNMRNDCLDCAVDEATAMISEIMSNPEYADELRSKLSDNHSGIGEAPISGSDFIWFFIAVACCVWIFTFGAYIFDVRKAKNLHGTGEKAMLWKNSLKTYLVLGILSGLTGLIFYVLAWRHYRKARYGSHPCPNCGGKTHLLKKSEAMAYLTPSQQFEEKLGSMEYDVHKCDKCGNAEVVPFITENSNYTRCPHCGTRAYHLVGTSELRHPTYANEGYGVKRYRCEYCGNQDEQGYRIPKKDMSGAVAAAAILGAASSRGSRGGGFGGGSFGGGFGGGMTGGGGASGRW
ncbi:MAG: TPM domain-containing protein [Muribaculum sp.]|nr:TPM domain-containing protein [Muribaculum sp.]